MPQNVIVKKRCGAFDEEDKIFREKYSIFLGCSKINSNVFFKGSFQDLEVFSISYTNQSQPVCSHLGQVLLNLMLCRGKEQLQVKCRACCFHSSFT